VFLIFNFLINTLRERLYNTSMLKDLYQFDTPVKYTTPGEENFDINKFSRINPYGANLSRGLTFNEQNLMSTKMSNKIKPAASPARKVTRGDSEEGKGLNINFAR
jgi:hypothetical protein